MAGRTRLDRARVLEAKDAAGAVDLYRQHLAKTPGDVGTWLRLAKLLEGEGDAAAAAAAFEGLAEAQSGAGFRSRAIASLHQALRLAPSGSDVALRLADLLVAEGKPADAASVLRGVAGQVKGGVRAAVTLWTKIVSLQPSAESTIRLAELLVADGQRDAAAERMCALANELSGSGREVEALTTLERALVLVPGQVMAADAAARIALRIGEPRRALMIARAGLDGAPEHPNLTALAAAALERMGEPAKAALLFRVAAARFGMLGKIDDEESSWRGVLRFDPADPHGREAVAPLVDADEAGAEMDLPVPPPRPLPLPPRPMSSMPELEIEIELALAAPSATIVPDLTAASIDAGWDDDDASLELETVAAPSSPSPLPAARPRTFSDVSPAAPPVDAAPVAARAPAPRTPALSIVPAPSPAPRSEPPVDAAGAILPQVHRALVIGDGPEVAWWRRAFVDHGLECIVAVPEELDEAVARAHEARCDVVVAPPELADAWRAAGDWLVIAPVLPTREELDVRLRAADVAAVDRRAVPTAEDLKQVIDTWGTPLELIGPTGAPLRVTGSAAPAYVHAVAKQKLGLPLFVQPVTDASIEVAVASSARAAIALGAWTVDSGELGGIVSVDEAGETEALALATEAAVALGIAGLAAFSLARVRGRFVVSSVTPLGALGGLLTEARTGLCLPIIAAELARGAPPPFGPLRRGHARATTATSLPLADVGGVRVEPSLTPGAAIVVASGATAVICERTLRRALGRPGVAPSSP